MHVTHTLLKAESLSQKKTKEFGELFESFIYLEIKANIDNLSPDSPLNFWWIEDENEVDFVINEKIAIKVKSTQLVHEKHLKGLKKFSSLGKVARQIIISLDKEKRKIEKVNISYTKSLVT